MNEYENQAWLDNWLKLKAKQEAEGFVSLEKSKEKIVNIAFTNMGLKGKLVIEGYPDLKQLNFSNNNLSEIIIRNCPDLKLVSLAHNQLTKLTIENCPSVQEIYTHNNQLTKLDVDVEELKKRNLRTISYSDNPLTIEEKARLDTLKLPDRVVISKVDGPAQDYLNAKYPLADRDKVEKLDLSSLGLQGELNLEGFVNLKRLDCSDNDLTGLNPEKCKNLEYLDCSNNKFSAKTRKNKRVENGISFLNLENNKNLQEVHASNCLLKSMKISGLAELKNLSISHNKLKRLNLNSLKSLKSLYFSSNKLTRTNLSKNIALKILVCDNNPIKKLEVKHLENLESLYCFKCSLTELDVSGLNKLEELYCANPTSYGDVNGNDWVKCLNSLKLEDCNNLKELDCAENYLTELVLSNKPKLLLVSCKMNNIGKLILKKVDNLEFLDFSENHNMLSGKTKLLTDGKSLQKMKEIFYSKGSLVPALDFFPLLEKAGIYERKVSNGKLILTSELVDVLALRNTKRVKKILVNPNDYALEDILKLGRKELQGVSQKLKEKLIELAKQKSEEVRKQKEKEFAEELRKKFGDKGYHFPGDEQEKPKTPSLEKDDLPSEEPPEIPTPVEIPTPEELPLPSENKQEEPNSKDKDKISELQQKNDELRNKIIELENKIRELGSGNANKQKVEEIRNEILASDLSEEQKQKLLKMLESKQNQTVSQSSNSTNPLPYILGMFVIVFVVLWFSLDADYKYN